MNNKYQKDSKSECLNEMLFTIAQFPKKNHQNKSPLALRFDVAETNWEALMHMCCMCLCGLYATYFDGGTVLE